LQNLKVLNLDRLREAAMQYENKNINKAVEMIAKLMLSEEGTNL
jgi:hypothetical protein